MVNQISAPTVPLCRHCGRALVSTLGRQDSRTILVMVHRTDWRREGDDGHLAESR